MHPRDMLRNFLLRHSDPQFQEQIMLGQPGCLGFLFKGAKESIVVAWCWEGAREVAIPVNAKETQP